MRAFRVSATFSATMAAVIPPPTMQRSASTVRATAQSPRRTGGAWSDASGGGPVSPPDRLDPSRGAGRSEALPIPRHVSFPPPRAGPGRGTGIPVPRPRSDSPEGPGASRRRAPRSRRRGASGPPPRGPGAGRPSGGRDPGARNGSRRCRSRGSARPRPRTRRATPRIPGPPHPDRRRPAHPGAPRPPRPAGPPGRGAEEASAVAGHGRLRPDDRAGRKRKRAEAVRSGPVIGEARRPRAGSRRRSRWRSPRAGDRRRWRRSWGWRSPGRGARLPRAAPPSPCRRRRGRRRPL